MGKIQDFYTKPDYEHWSQMARWELEWATALSLNLEPSIISLESVSGEDFPPELKQSYLKRFDVVDNHAKAGRLPHHVEPADFISWAKSNGLDYPPALENAVKTRGGMIADWRRESERLRETLSMANADVVRFMAERDGLKAEVGRFAARLSGLEGKDRPLIPKERQSLLKVVAGMAVVHYRFDPKATRSSVARKIWNDVIAAGLNIDEDTVHKWLDEAAKLLE